MATLIIATLTYGQNNITTNMQLMHFLSGRSEPTKYMYRFQFQFDLRGNSWDIQLTSAPLYNNEMQMQMHRQKRTAKPLQKQNHFTVVLNFTRWCLHWHALCDQYLCNIKCIALCRLPCIILTVSFCSSVWYTPLFDFVMYLCTFLNVLPFCHFGHIKRIQLEKSKHFGN